MFEFDDEKSQTNKIKHGLDFQEAQKLWEVPSVILRSKFTDEIRYLLIGKLDDKCWTAIFTERHYLIRIISVRRSRKEERIKYEQNIKE